MEANSESRPAYRSLWMWPLLAWAASAARSTITRHTPFEKRSFGMGVAITGLPIGITIAFVTTPFLIDLGNAVLGPNNGWRMPFFVLGIVTLLVWFSIARFFRRQREGEFR